MGQELCKNKIKMFEKLKMTQNWKSIWILSSDVNRVTCS
jgi:hypothetical protein